MKKIEGIIVALVTPFKEEKIDEKGIQELVEFQIRAGTHGICPCGTTGEAATLSFEEHKKVVEIVIDQVGGRIPVIAGTGSNSTTEAIFLTKHAQKVGADAALLITPYYNRPTQEGLFRHFSKIASEVSIPIILYNVPSRTGVNMLPETVERLSRISNIVGIKEASASLAQASEILNLCPEDFTLLSGEDMLILPILAIGGKGAISVTTNVMPRDTSDLYNTFMTGNWEKAKSLHYKLLPLAKSLFLETNPIPVKAALGLMGKISPELRLPLTPMSSENLQKLKRVIREYGLIG